MLKFLLTVTNKYPIWCQYSVLFHPLQFMILSLCICKWKCKCKSLIVVAPQLISWNNFLIELHSLYHTTILTSQSNNFVLFQAPRQLSHCQLPLLSSQLPLLRWETSKWERPPVSFIALPRWLRGMPQLLDSGSSTAATATAGGIVLHRPPARSRIHVPSRAAAAHSRPSWNLRHPQV